MWELYTLKQTQVCLIVKCERVLIYQYQCINYNYKRVQKYKHIFNIGKTSWNVYNRVKRNYGNENRTKTSPTLWLKYKLLLGMGRRTIGGIFAAMRRV